MKKLKIFPKTFLYTLGLMLVIVLLSHMLIYFFMPWAYNYQQEKTLEADADALADKIISATPDERVTYVTDFAAKWNANVTITYDDFSFTVDLLKTEPGAPPNSNGKAEFTIIADATEDGLKSRLQRTLTVGQISLGLSRLLQAEQEGLQPPFPASILKMPLAQC